MSACSVCVCVGVCGCVLCAWCAGGGEREEGNGGREREERGSEGGKEREKRERDRRDGDRVHMPHLSQGVDFHCVRCTKFLEGKRVISKQCGLREMISHILLSRVGHRLRQRCPDHYRCPVGRSSAVLKKVTCLSLAASRTVGMGSKVFLVFHGCL
jgi:hypothetical protein